METFTMWIAYGFEILIGLFAVGLYTLVLAGMFDESMNRQAKKVASYILGINEEGYHD